MLKIIFGEVEHGGYHPPTYFDNRYEDQWITHPLTVEMIRDNCAKWIARLGKHPYRPGKRTSHGQFV